MPAFRCSRRDSSVLTVEFKINLVAPAKGERLRAIGAVIKPGRTLTICDLKVFAIAGEREIALRDRAANADPPG